MWYLTWSRCSSYKSRSLVTSDMHNSSIDPDCCSSKCQKLFAEWEICRFCTFPSSPLCHFTRRTFHSKRDAPPHKGASHRRAFSFRLDTASCASQRRVGTNSVTSAQVTWLRSGTDQGANWWKHAGDCMQTPLVWSIQSFGDPHLLIRILIIWGQARTKQQTRLAAEEPLRSSLTPNPDNTTLNE